ncbi:MAG: DNA primase [Phycisphaerales bacterium]|nr:DNA primase [Phycisphaerales bacterium]
MTLYPRDNNDRDRVREAADIVRVVGEAVALKPKGREFVGLCPFHDDHKPSMNVVPSKQIFHCFVCGAGGDVFTFVEKFYKMDFREALEFLAEKFSIELAPRRAAGATGSSGPVIDAGPTRADLIRACQTASDFYRAILRHPDHGAVARAIIDRRGISPGMQDAFQVGAAPNRWDGLLMTLRGKNLPENAFLEAGLLRRRDDSGGGGHYDYFRNRLIFPIHDLSGRAIAFGARKIDEADEPKYLNSPDTRLFRKSSTLYGLFQASRSIQRDRTALITEGYTDTIACHQAGFTSAVATLGTALTRDHAALLRRICDTVILLFDGDEAGQRAADRAAEVFFAEPIDVRIVTLNSHTDAKDPDELLKREGGTDVFRKAIDAATDLLDFRFARLRERLKGAGLSALSRGIEEEVEKLVALGLADVPPLRKRLITKRLAQLAGVDEATILRTIPAGRGPASPRPSQADPRPDIKPLADSSLTAAEHLLGCILCEGALWFSLDEARRDFLGPAAYRSPLFAAVAQAVDAVARSGSQPGLDAVLSRLRDTDAHNEVIQAAVGLQQHIETITGQSSRLQDHWRSCLAAADRDAAARAGGQPVSNPTQSALARIESARRKQTEFGGDLRVFPDAARGRDR